MSEKLRILIDPAADGALNMAIDETLSETQADPQAPPTLRFYQWSQPTVTVGYFEKIDNAVRLFRAEKKSLPVIRRLTGGGGVLHGEDLTFSLTLRTPNRFFANDVKTSYLKINEVIRKALIHAHPTMDYADCRTSSSQSLRQKNNICFEAPSCYDLLEHGHKVLGASQRRLGAVLLHQSSLFLKDPRELMVEKISESFCRAWNLEPFVDRLSDEEWRRSHEIEAERYGDAQWAWRGSSFLSCLSADRREAALRS